ncbi:hypothetical protein D3C87_280080 [compost metagenome]
MNKYLEKAAELKEDLTGKVKAPLKPHKPGKNLISGAKTLFSKALVKAAYAPMSRGQPTEGASGGVAVKRDRTDAMLISKVDSDHMKEIRETGVIGAVGAGTGLLGTKILSKVPRVAKSNAKTLALMGGLGLAGDYAAVKINKAFGKNKS